jgi:hypothetical protein
MVQMGDIRRCGSGTSNYPPARAHDIGLQRFQVIQIFHSITSIIVVVEETIGR